MSKTRDAAKRLPKEKAMWFAYGDGMYEEFNTAPEAKKFASDVLDEFRSDADEGWSDESLNVCWGQVIETVEATSSRPATEDDRLIGDDIDGLTIQERELVPLNKYWELENPSEGYACFTGDCPHATVHESLEGLKVFVDEQHQESERLRALATHAADDEEEIDEGWLIRCGAEWKNWFYAYSECQYEELTIEAGNTYLIIDDEDVRLLGGEPIANIKTRGRFRQLYFLLSGEELQEGA